MRAALADTGPLVALFVKGDPDHRRVKSFLKGFQGGLLSTWPVLTEVCHFLEPRIAAEFMRWIENGGAAIVEMPPSEVTLLRRLMEKYVDRPMDLADASLVCLAANTGVTDVLTLDHGDFEIYRTASGATFTDLLALAVGKPRRRG